MLRELLLRISDAIPSQCAVCHRWPAQPVCEACIERFAQPVPRCRSCAAPVVAGVAHCGACLVSPPPWDACVAAVAYEFPWSGLIVEFKFRDRPGWAASFATLMRSAPWVEPALDRADLVLPMPLARARLAERGFNQALELARHLAPGKVAPSLLLRGRATSAQSTLGRAERLRNVRGAFLVDPLQAARLARCSVVLLDDVMTSGASMLEASLALRAVGVGQITAMVLARADLHDADH